MDLNNNVIKKLQTNTMFDYISPTIKILSFLIFIVIVFVAENIFILLITLLISSLFLLSINIKAKYFLKPLLILVIFYPFTVIFNMLVIEGTNEPLFWIGNQAIYSISLIISLQIFLKIYLLILVSSVLILSLTETELTNGLEKLISPLKVIKVPTQEIALVISIALRYIPTFIYETKVILQSQASRGIDYYSGNLNTKIKALKNSLNPLIINSFFKSKELSMAMAVRGYSINMKRTKYEIYTFKLKEFLLLGFFIFFFISILLLNIYNVNLLNIWNT